MTFILVTCFKISGRKLTIMYLNYKQQWTGAKSWLKIINEVKYTTTVK